MNKFLSVRCGVYTSVQPVSVQKGLVDHCTYSVYELLQKWRMPCRKSLRSGESLHGTEAPAGGCTLAQNGIKVTKEGSFSTDGLVVGKRASVLVIDMEMER